MKIVDIKSYTKAVDKLDKMAEQPEVPKLGAIFTDESSISKLNKFFDIADGNSIWTD